MTFPKKDPVIESTNRRIHAFLRRASIEREEKKVKLRPEVQRFLIRQEQKKAAANHRQANADIKRAFAQHYHWRSTHSCHVPGQGFNLHRLDLLPLPAREKKPDAQKQETPAPSFLPPIHRKPL